MVDEAGHVVDLSSRHAGRSEECVELRGDKPLGVLSDGAITGAPVLHAQLVGRELRAIGQRRTPEHVSSQQVPTAVVLDADQDLAVYRRIGVVRGDGGMTQHHPRNLLSSVQLHVHGMPEPFGRRIEHRSEEHTSELQSH